MNRLVGPAWRNFKMMRHLSTASANSKPHDDSDLFGKENLFSQLDSRKKNLAKYTKNQIQTRKGSEDNVDPADTFGTITNEHKSM